MPVRVVNTHEAKSRLSELIREAEEGTEVIVARNGRPVARIVPWRPVHAVRVAGAWAGRVVSHGDHVAPDEEIAAMFDAAAARALP